ncbi:HAMP domain-containing protein [Anoxynatronum buryatiense]|uniref:HAMP domain-containing protein n=1 Tax=Anoxynatronum buryatiense TaxID=489973 RepID=A0AA46AJR9_9CLOT|nr:HAMP domain-containing protein [Anoxynatronum buryatiense]SMP65116.1 HAMP domain-containing protein [Anoxynatronum buryatiense]
MKRMTAKKRKGFSLTFKVSMTITLLITFLMLGMGTMTYFMNQRVLIQQETRQGKSIAMFAGEIMENAMTGSDTEPMLSVISLMKEDPKITQVYVTNIKGEIMAHDQQERLGNHMQSRALSAAMEQGVLQVQQTTSETGDRPVLLFVVPLANVLGQTDAYLHFTTDLLPAQQFLMESALQWVKIFVGVVLVSLVLIRIIIVKSVGKPVKQLLTATEQAAVGDFSGELEPAAADELGHLAEGFNLMNRQLGVLFRSIYQTVEEMDYASKLIVNRSETMASADDSWSADKQQEWLREILSSGKRLTRVSQKLQTFLNQFQVKDERS